MIRLIGYEFRKSATGILTLAGIFAALEIAFLIGLYGDHINLIVIAGMGMSIGAMASALYCFLRGITSYTSELSQRSGWMMFMTPNSMGAIVASRFLFTLLIGLGFGLFGALLAWLDYRPAIGAHPDWALQIEGTGNLLTIGGLPVQAILWIAVYGIALSLLQLMAVVGLAYLSVTLSRTLLSERKWRWVVSLALFVGLFLGMNKVLSLFPTPTVYLERLLEIGRLTYTETLEMGANVRGALLPSLLPRAGVCLGVLLATGFGCASLLKRKICL